MGDQVLYQQGRGILVSTAAAITSSGPPQTDLKAERFNAVTLTITGLAAETVAMTLSTDGGTTFGTTKIAAALISTPTTLVTDMTNGTYQVPWYPACTHIRLTKSAGANTVTIQYLLRQS